MYDQIEQKLKKIQNNEENYIDDKAMLFVCKLELIDLCSKIKFDKE